MIGRPDGGSSARRPASTRPRPDSGSPRRLRRGTRRARPAPVQRSSRCCPAAACRRRAAARPPPGSPARFRAGQRRLRRSTPTRRARCVATVERQPWCLLGCEAPSCPTIGSPAQLRSRGTTGRMWRCSCEAARMTIPSLARIRSRTPAFAASLALALVALLPAGVRTQQKEPPRAAVVLGFLDAPGYLPFDERLLSALSVAPGFAVSVFAQPGGNARMMAAGPDGAIYLTRQEQGDVLLLRDRDGDGKAEEMRVVATGLRLVHGVAVHDTAVYLVAPRIVWRAAILADGSLAEPVVLIDDLPDGGQHRARNIKVGPGGRLYISVGSTCNACNETNPENATILRANIDGSGREILARGLRHTVGFDWQPDTGELWGWDMGTDWRGNTIPPEEINRIEEGAHYGWPYCFGDRQIDRWLNVGPPNQ